MGRTDAATLAKTGACTNHTNGPATNTLVGTPDTPVDIAPGGFQSYVFAFAPIAAFNSTDVQLNFDCFNTNPAPVTVGLDTLLLMALSAPVPDIVALSATLVAVFLYGIE